MPSGYAQLLVWQIKQAGLPAPVQELVFAPPRRWRFDLAWESHMLACEVEGAVYRQGRHTRGAGFEKDAIKYAERQTITASGPRARTVQYRKKG